MNILLYSPVFWPSLGGVEATTATLADSLVRLGHACTVVTETPLNTRDERRRYEVVRAPGFTHRFALVKQSSIVHSNGSSMAMFPYARVAGRPFVWTHNGYQVSCVDGLGWADGEPAPITAVASLRHHYARAGLAHLLRESVKLAVRRCVARHVDLNIACTRWVAYRQPLRKQVVAYTPYDLERFAHAARNERPVYDFVYVGRLVSEKGLPDLLKALHLLLASPDHRNRTLAVVGDGYLRGRLRDMAAELGVDKNVVFLGPQHGADLVRTVALSRVGVVPSRWEEPMGGIALQFLAAGKNVIVSSHGGHAECVGDAGLRFANGDHHALHQCMLRILTDGSLADRQRENAATQVRAFDELELTRRYIALYEQVIQRNRYSAAVRWIARSRT
jgi:glycosyltransferase involved in cell wall biosynthesis